MYLATVAWLTSMPSLSSSPWIRGAPQSGLAPLICRIRSRTSRSTDGRPDLERSAKTGGSLGDVIGRRWLADQHHRHQTARPQSVEQGPEQAVGREQLGPT